MGFKKLMAHIPPKELIYALASLRGLPKLFKIKRLNIYPFRFGTRNLHSSFGLQEISGLHSSFGYQELIGLQSSFGYQV
jgi:hypothetical protein